jgi:hypothetical protein
MNTGVIITITILLILVVAVVVFVIFTNLDITIKIVITAVSVIIFTILSIFILYRMKSSRLIKRKTLISKKTIGRRRAKAALPRVLSEISEESEEEIPEDACYMSIGGFKVNKKNDAFFNIFIIFISRLSRLVDIPFDEEFKNTVMILCNDDFDPESQVSYLNKLLTSAPKMQVSIRNCENIFKLLKSSMQLDNEEPLNKRRIYAIDELKFNLLLLLAANSITVQYKKMYIPIYQTLSNTIYKYKSPLVDVRTYCLRSFFKYLKKFRISEVLIPGESSFLFIEEIRYSLIGNSIRFRSKHNIVQSLNEVVTVLHPSLRSEGCKPMYIIITFYPEYSEGAKRINDFRLSGYEITSIIFSKQNVYSLLTIERIKGNVCLVTNEQIRNGNLDPVYYKKQGDLLEMIEKIDKKNKANLLSSDIICILYELKLDSNSMISGIKSIPYIDLGDAESRFKEKKKEFEILMNKFSDIYNKLQPKRETIIFKILEFIKLSTGNAGDEGSVIRKYLFGFESRAISSKMYIAPFIKRVVKDFFSMNFEPVVSQESTPRLWNNIIQEVKSYDKDSTTDSKILLKNAVENTMKIFTHIINGAFGLFIIREKAHCDYILATIYLIKKLWKVYDRCMAVMKTLEGREEIADYEEDVLLRYVLLKFNQLMYIKCYFASFSVDTFKMPELEDKRLKLEKEYLQPEKI